MSGPGIDQPPSHVLFTYANDISRLHLVKVLLSFLAERQTFADKQSFCEHLRLRGSRSGLSSSASAPTPAELDNGADVDSMAVRGRELYEKLKRGSLPVSGFTDSGGDSQLIQFGLQEMLLPDYLPNLPQSPPEKFQLVRDLALLENCLGVKCIFYLPFHSDVDCPQSATSVRYIKLLETLQYQTMSTFLHAGQMEMECYEIVLRPRQLSDGSSQIEFQVVIEGSLNYSIMRDEARFMSVIKYFHTACPIWYSFEEHEVCHVDTFRRHFLRHMLPQNPDTIGLLTEYQKRMADSVHVCQDNLKWCYRICGLQLLMNDFFAGFPASILFLVVEGINWFVNEANVKNRLLSGYREKLPSMKSYATRVIFKYLPPRRPDEDVAEYELKTRADPEFMVILSGRVLYLCNERTRRELIKFCLTRGEVGSKVTKKKKKKKTNSCESDGQLDVQAFVGRMRDQVEKEKRQLLGQSGFSSAKCKKEYRERCHKLKERLGENFAEHCTPICSRLPEIARHVPVGKPSKLYTIARPLESLLREIGLLSAEIEAQIKKCLSLSCFAFDTETMGIPANETQDNSPHRVYNTEDGTFAQFGMQDQPEPDGPGTRPVILQELLVIGVVDHHDDACLPQSKLPYVFMWPRQLYHTPVVAQLYMMEAFLVFLMKKQIFLFHEKFKRLESIFDVIQHYQRVYYDMFLQRHSLTELDLFPCKLLKAVLLGTAGAHDPASHHLLTDFEEIFFTPQHERLDDLFANWDRQFSSHKRWESNSSSSSSQVEVVEPATLPVTRRARQQKKRQEMLQADSGNTQSLANRGRKSRKRKRQNPFILHECGSGQADDASQDEQEEEEATVAAANPGCDSDASQTSSSDDVDSDMNDFIVPNDQVMTDDDAAAYARVNNASVAAASEEGEEGVPPSTLVDHQDPVLKAREHILNLRQFWFGSVFGQIQIKLMQMCCKQIVYGFNMEVSVKNIYI